MSAQNSMPQFRMALPQAPPRELPPYLATREPVELASGFYDREHEGLDEYRWMGLSAVLAFGPDARERFLECWAFSEFRDLSQVLSCSRAGTVDRVPLVHGWSPLSLAIPPGAERVELAVNKLFPAAYYPADSRSLGIRLRPPHLHRDPVRHGHLVRQHANAVENAREMLEGRNALASTPVSLGIDLHGACNVKPPCVYCEWDYNKDLEGDYVDAPFTLDTLREWGPIFDNSLSLVNCSIGEPFMMKNFDDLLDAFGDGGKVLEMTTNGQILTDRNIQRLLGRSIDLYVSLDAGTAATYAKLRNDRFDAILQNLRRLIDAKGGRGHLPRVHLVFMPMRVNVHELDQFVRIAAELRVDRVVLRPLNYSDSIGLTWDRGGHRFEYPKELLPFEDLVRVSGRAAELCRRLDVPLADQMDFGGSMGDQFARWFEEGSRAAAETLEVPTAGEPAPQVPADGGAPVGQPQQGRQSAASAPAGPDGPLPSLGAERMPACTEPWKSLYILRRGVFPCCYGGAPIAPMDQHREAWNSPLMQGIRRELAHGRFHDYCLRSPACPIIRKSQEADTLPPSQARRLRLRRWWTRLDRVSRGLPGRVYRGFRWTGIRVRRLVTDPRYPGRIATRLTSRGSSDRPAAG
jgi:pyruvate-formate lyase-activating enzyme